MAGFGRRSKPLKAGTAIAEVGGVSLTALADDDLLVYDATSEAFLNTKTLGGSYVIGGGLTAATLTTSGNAALGGALSVAGSATVAGTLAVGGTSTLEAAAMSSLSVSGGTTLVGATTIVGGLSANAADFAQFVTMNFGLMVFGTTTLGAVSAASLDVSGTLDVDGAVVLGSNVGVVGDLSVIGSLSTGSAFSAPAIGSTGTLTAGGATTLFSTLSVSGAATLASTLAVTGAATLSSSLSVGTTLNVTGTVTGLSTASFGTVAGAYSITDGWGISGALTNAVTGNQDVKISLRNGGRSVQVAQIGFETGTTFAIRSQTHGGTLLMTAEDSAGNVEQAFAYVPDGGGFLYHAGLNRAYTTSTGFAISGSLNNAVTGNQDAQLSLRNAGLTTEMCLIGYQTGLGLVIRNQTHGGSITMSVEDASGNVETGLVITPDAGVTLSFANSVTLETVSGGAKTTGAHQITGNLDHDGSNVGFYNTAPAAQQTVTGSRGGNAALASLLTALATIGLITDSSSA